MLHQEFHFEWYTGQESKIFTVLLYGHAGCCSHVIKQNKGISQHIGLPPVYLGHIAVASSFKYVFHMRQYSWITHQGGIEVSGNGFLVHSIFRRDRKSGVEVSNVIS